MAVETLLPDLQSAPLSTLAKLISHHWEKPCYLACPYLVSMHRCCAMDDRVGLADGYRIVASFLNHSSSWKGDVANQIKTELRRRLKL